MSPLELNDRLEQPPNPDQIKVEQIDLSVSELVLTSLILGNEFTLPSTSLSSALAGPATPTSPTTRFLPPEMQDCPCRLCR